MEKIKMLLLAFMSNKYYTIPWGHWNIFRLLCASFGVVQILINNFQTFYNLLLSRKSLQQKFVTNKGHKVLRSFSSVLHVCDIWYSVASWSSQKSETCSMTIFLYCKIILKYILLSSWPSDTFSSTFPEYPLLPVS